MCNVFLAFTKNMPVLLKTCSYALRVRLFLLLEYAMNIPHFYSYFDI